MNSNPEPKWVKIAGMVAEATVGHFTGKTIDVILKQILQTQSEELRLLTTIARDVRSLKQGPFNTGLIYLEEASKRHKTVSEKKTSIIKAKDSFYVALGQELEHYRKALIQFHIATCWIMLNKNKDAFDWYRKAYNSASQALTDMWLEGWFRPTRKIGNAKPPEAFMYLGDFYFEIKKIFNKARDPIVIQSISELNKKYKKELRSCSILELIEAMELMERRIPDLSLDHSNNLDLPKQWARRLLSLS